MISKVNGVFQECPTISWYGEVNKTCCLRRKLGLQSEHSSAVGKHTGGVLRSGTVHAGQTEGPVDEDGLQRPRV